MIHWDKKGLPFEVRPYQEEDLSPLLAMYERFNPKGRFQGVPPRDQAACRDWACGLVDAGVNILALRRETVIGHVVLIPDPEGDQAEYLIFVEQSNRNRGVGTRLTQTALEDAGCRGLKRLWLSVGTYNFPAIALYLKAGFRFTDAGRFESERTMELIIGAAS